MATVKLTYRASSNLTVTNLHSIATSATWVAGWTSGTIDNTSNVDLDILISGGITLGSSPSVAQVRMYVYPMLDDSTWPDVFSAGTEGTEGTATIHDITRRDAAFRLLWAVETAATTNAIYYIPKCSIAALFGGATPSKFALFVTHSTGVNLHSSGNQVTTQGVYLTNA